MKNKILFNDGWQFTMKGCQPAEVTLPHTWNGKDGQDGGNDYKRCACTYTKSFKKPVLKNGDRCVILFKGVNSQATVKLNGKQVCYHEGGYSSFSADITDVLSEDNVIEVTADNAPCETVYPQTADFTFYGGIYRDVWLCILPQTGFTFGEYCSNPLKADCKVKGADGVLNVKATVKSDAEYAVTIAVYDGDKKVAEGTAGSDIVIKNVHLWNGTKDPFMYRVQATLTSDGVACDTAEVNVGFRTFAVDPKKGFILNGKVYPLRGVSRHQDRPDKGNAISRADHEQDMALIKEIGANTVRLAHYQHDDYFYDLCDKNGLVVWAEVPYISRHMNGADGNIKEQMKELILQQYNHPSICFWGVSNEITMKKCDKKDMLKTHRELNELCHKLDPSRQTTLACYAMCGPFNKTSKITDVVSWNLYLGWYVPGMFLNDLWMWFYHLVHPKRCIGYSEYGAEGMPNLHAAKPKRFDNTEEYQAKYHEFMLRFFDRHPYMWATHVWNMFDFAADGRNQGGDPGKNHKGLVTFDRNTKKDSFYLYKAHWSAEPVLHLCGKRYINRTGSKTEITVYTNVGNVNVYNNGKIVASSNGEKVFKCKIALEKKNEIIVKAANLSDSVTVYKVDKPDPSYKVTSGNSMSWEK
ncbi:MAG: glycoside hydrolase family 2 protein [Clostridia bacterium]|nr:glycoside hydrolase family 2 protein [Clostridia bacterium]